MNQEKTQQGVTFTLLQLREIMPMTLAEDIITRKINGGLNGLNERKSFLERARMVLLRG